MIQKERKEHGKVVDFMLIILQIQLSPMGFALNDAHWYSEMYFRGKETLEPVSDRLLHREP